MAELDVFFTSVVFHAREGSIQIFHHTFEFVGFHGNAVVTIVEKTKLATPDISKAFERARELGQAMTAVELPTWPPAEQST